MRLLILALVALALTPATASAFDPAGWRGAGTAVVSPDGAHVYAGGSPLLGFSIDRSSGALERVDSQPGSPAPAPLAIAPDGRHLYAGFGGSGGGSGVLVYSRNATTGRLTHESTLATGASPGFGRSGPSSIAVSADGAHVYVTRSGDDVLLALARDPASGALSVRQTLYAGPGGDLPGQSMVSDLALSPDGRFAYVIGNGISVLARDPAEGSLTPLARAEGSGFAIATAPDGGRVYGGTSDYHSFDRSADGSLSFRGRSGLFPGGCCPTGGEIAVSPDSAWVFSTAPDESTIAQARVTGDGVEAARYYRDGQDGNAGLSRPRGLAWSPDGSFLTVASPESYPAGGVLSVYRWNGSGLTFAASTGPIRVLLPVPAGPSAVTVNNGAVYTNDPEVTVSVVPPGQVASLRLSNVPGVFDGPATRTDGAASYRWRLDTGTTTRDVKRVHVRFTPGPGGDHSDRFDDIILDQRRPALVAAKLRRGRLALRARDNRSGVRRVQVTKRRARPGKARPFRSRIKVPSGARRLYVRVADGAGNRSRWHRVVAR